MKAIIRLLTVAVLCATVIHITHYKRSIDVKCYVSTLIAN